MCRSYEWQKKNAITCTKCGVVVLDKPIADHEKTCSDKLMKEFDKLMKDCK